MALEVDKVGKGGVGLVIEITRTCGFFKESQWVCTLWLDFSIERSAHEHGYHEDGQHIDNHRRAMIDETRSRSKIY